MIECTFQILHRSDVFPGISKKNTARSMFDKTLINVNLTEYQIIITFNFDPIIAANNFSMSDRSHDLRHSGHSIFNQIGDFLRYTRSFQSFWLFKSCDTSM